MDPGPPRKLLKLYNDPGHAHFLTFSCYRRRPYLSIDLTRNWLADSLTTACGKHNFELWAYVFMPEHVHLLTKPRQESYSVGGFLRSVKFGVSHRVKRYSGENLQSDPLESNLLREIRESGQFWQNGPGYDRNLWSLGDIIERIGYVHNNPVKRRLADQETKWMWSSASDYAGTSNGRVPVTPFGKNLE
jgi:putative transposase